MLKMLFGLLCSYIRWNPTLLLSLFPLWVSVVWNSDYFPLSNESHLKKKKWLTFPYSQFRCSVKPVGSDMLVFLPGDCQWPEPSRSYPSRGDCHPGLSTGEHVSTASCCGSAHSGMCCGRVKEGRMFAYYISWKLWLHKQDRGLGCNPAGGGAAWYFFPVALPQNLGWFVK